MNAKLQRRIQRYGWDKSAPFYEKYWQQLEPVQKHLLSMANLQPGEHVLDVACGTGLVTLRAAAAVGLSGRVMGTDISEVMVATASQMADSQGMKQVTIEQMDAEQLQFADNAFDVVLCSLGLMYLPDPFKAITEMLRVLKPGGRVATAVWGQREKCGWAELFPIVDARVNSKVCPLFFRLGTQDTLAKMFQAVGFVGVLSERLFASLQYDSATAASGAAFAGGPVALAYARFDKPTRAEVEAEYLASIAPYHSGKGYSIPAEFVLAYGRKL